MESSSSFLVYKINPPPPLPKNQLIWHILFWDLLILLLIA